jgi:hypothetical protein
MKQGIKKARVQASVLAAMLAPPFAFAATWMDSSPAEAAAKAACRVHAVLADKQTEAPLPKELEFLRETLKDDQFAAYKGFHLVDKQTLALTEGSAAQASFGSGHKLALTLRGSDDKRVRLHLELTNRDGQGKLVATDYSIEDNGLFMIQAGSHTKGKIEGKLFFAIQCARPNG